MTNIILASLGAGMSNLCSNTVANRGSVQSKVDTIKSVVPALCSVNTREKTL